jgi:hypothetical protein
MTNLKTHYQIWVYGDENAQDAWTREGLVNGKVKFCDGLMLKKDRELDFSKDAEGVDCSKCRAKIESWFENGFELPYTG